MVLYLNRGKVGCASELDFHHHFVVDEGEWRHLNQSVRKVEIQWGGNVPLLGEGVVVYGVILVENHYIFVVVIDLALLWLLHVHYLLVGCLRHNVEVLFSLEDVEDSARGGDQKSEALDGELRVEGLCVGGEIDEVGGFLQEDFNGVVVQLVEYPVEDLLVGVLDALKVDLALLEEILCEDVLRLATVCLVVEKTAERVLLFADVDDVDFVKEIADFDEGVDSLA